GARLLTGWFELALAPVVRLELVHDALTEDAQGREECVDLVQRVRPSLLRVDVERELDDPRAGAQLQDHLRLEVVCALLAVRIITLAVVGEVALARVLDIHEDVCVAVETGQVQEYALVDSSAVGKAHVLILSSDLSNKRRG